MPTYQHLDRTIVAALLISADNKLLLGKKSQDGTYPNCWHLPGGGVKVGETLEQALIREVKEETGLDISREQLALVDEEGRGTHLKRKAKGQPITVRMDFKVFKVLLPQRASGLQVTAGDDLVELQWVDVDKLGELQHTPTSTALFERLGMI